jgi:Na+-translocating ferredoxin:NAD+ oxidoreductase RnfE subunit
VDGCDANCSKGIWKENAVFKLLLGMCPLLAAMNKFENHYCKKI